MSGVKFVPKRGVVADFDLNPIRGSETGKTRPCIVVTNNIYNSKLTSKRLSEKLFFIFKLLVLPPRPPILGGAGWKVPQTWGIS